MEEDEEDDEEEITPAVVPGFFGESQLPGSQGAGPDPTDQKPSSLRWDPATGRARLSLRAAVRNHTPNEDWSLSALREYALTRRFVLLSRVPPKEGQPGAPTSEEIDQAAQDVFTLRATALTARWRRARVQAQRQREELAAAADDDEEEEEDDDDDDDDPEARLDMEDDEEAEAAWKTAKVQELRRQIIARWAEICQMLLLILTVTRFLLTFAPFHYIRTPFPTNAAGAPLWPRLRLAPPGKWPRGQHRDPTRGNLVAEATARRDRDHQFGQLAVLRPVD